MPRTLTDEDCELIAQKVIEALSRRLATPPPAAPPEATQSSRAAASSDDRPHKLAYTGKEVQQMLGVSTTTLWRLRVLGRIQPVPGLRRIVFAHDEVERFLRTSPPESVNGDAKTRAGGSGSPRSGKTR